MLPHFDNYDGQTVQELVALKNAYVNYSLVLAVGKGLDNKPLEQLSEAERVVLAVEALGREVNNGGYMQFFVNTPEYTSFIVRALELIKCPTFKAITADAIAVLKLPAAYDSERVTDKAVGLAEQDYRRLGECDVRYYDCAEPIDDALFAYIESHMAEIRIPYEAGLRKSR